MNSSAGDTKIYVNERNQLFIIPTYIFIFFEFPIDPIALFWIQTVFD